MARKDKILDILSLAQLSDEAKIARLAHRWVGKSMSVSQARAIAEVYFGFSQRAEMTRKLFDEHHRQQKLRNSRQAFATAAAERQKSPMLRYQGPQGTRNRKARMMELAQDTFGEHVRENFNDDTLALMSLISGENRTYRVVWLDAGFQPKRCALIEVCVNGKGKLRNRFMLYKVGRRVLVARTSASTLKGAWSGQVSSALAQNVESLIHAGNRIENDLEDQCFRVFDPEGSEVMRHPWEGQTVA